MEVLLATAYVITALIVYKLLDRLLRLPKLGNFKDMYILVTGCDSGFGLDIAKRLDAMGCHVFAACLTEQGEVALRKQCSNRLHAVHMDVTDSASINKAYAEIENALPEGKGLWGLINNAGVVGAIGAVDWFLMKDYQQVLDVNLLGLIEVTVTFLPLIKRAGGGRIVNTSSMVGRCSSIGTTPYCISKYGVEAFSDSLRRQLRFFNTTVHLIEPGFYKTNMTNLESWEKSFRRTWTRAPAAIQEEYGQEFPDLVFKETMNPVFDALVSNQASDVTDAYEHALLGCYPRARYVVGNLTNRLFLPLNELTPEWFSDWLIERVSGLHKVVPKCKQ